MKLVSYSTQNSEVEINKTSKGYAVELFNKTNGVTTAVTSTVFPTLELATEELDNILSTLEVTSEIVLPTTKL